MSHKTDAGERRKDLLAQARKIRKDAAKARQLVSDSQDAARLEMEAASVTDQADRMGIAARLQDMSLWTLTKERDTTEGRRKYEYWYVSWREGSRVRNVYLGARQGPRKMDRDTAWTKARRLKREALRYGTT